MKMWVIKCVRGSHIQPMTPMLLTEDQGYTEDNVVATAKRWASKYSRDYQVYKVIETHYVKHPVVPEPEVTEVNDANAG